MHARALDLRAIPREEIMIKSRLIGSIGVLLMGCPALVLAADAKVKTTVIFDGVSSEVGAPNKASNDLWITFADPTRATMFEVKPEGVCSGSLCFPLPDARKKDYIEDRKSISWFNLSAFARLLKQPMARDEKHDVWFFGPRPDAQNSFVSTLSAPDFTLPDLSGQKHSLSEFRGKKVLLITWASW
jgi:hypothetical protein